MTTACKLPSAVVNLTMAQLESSASKVRASTLQLAMPVTLLLSKIVVNFSAVSVAGIFEMKISRHSTGEVSVSNSTSYATRNTLQNTQQSLITADTFFSCCLTRNCFNYQRLSKSVFTDDCSATFKQCFTYT